MNTFKRFVQLLAFTVVFCVVGLVGQSAHAATATIVTGRVLYPDNITGVAAFQVTLYGTANVVLGTTSTDSSGIYTFTLDDTGLSGQSLHVQMTGTAPAGYTYPGGGDSRTDFTYSGTPVTAVTFYLGYIRKYIDITVEDDQGTLREADAIAYPLFNTPYSGDSGHIGSTGTLSVEEQGKYLVTGDCNLSSSASQCPFIVTNPGQVIEFVEANDVEEHVAVTIRLAYAQITVTGQFLDVNGANIYQPSGFQPDITFTGYNKDYGVISTRRKVGADGTVSIKLIPGVWTAMPSTKELGVAYETQTFYPADATFILSSTNAPITEASYDFGTVQAVANTGVISGSLEEIDLSVSGLAPQAIDHVGVVATNTTTGGHYETTTDQNGNFSFTTLSFGDFALTVDSSDYIPVQSAYATVSPANPSATGVTIQVIATDTTISGTVVEGFDIQNSLPAVVVATDDAGHTYSANVTPEGTYELNIPSDQLSSDQLQVQLITQPGANVFMAEPQTVTVVPNTTIDADLSVTSDEATISGTLNNAQSTAMVTELGNEAKVTAINTLSGSTEEATVGEDGTWSMSVGAGDWQIIPQVTDPDATVVVNTMSNKTVTVGASDVVTDVELRVLETAGTTTGTLTDPSGNPLAEVPVTLSNLPALQAEAATNGTDVNQSKVVEVTTTTDSNGEYTQNLPAGDYTAHFLSNPEASDFVEPQAETFKVKAGQTETVDAVYVDPNKAISGDISGDDLTQVSVVAYQSDGGMRELTVDPTTNTYTGELVAGDWTVVTSGIKNGDLFTDTDTVTVSGSDTTYNPKPTDTGIVIPATVSASGSDTSAVVLSNTEGASVSIPAYAVGQSGNYTVELVPDPQVVVNGGTSQIGLAYDVNVVDTTTGRSISQLYRPIAVHIPIDNTSDAAITTDEISAAFYDPDLQAYLSDGMTAETNGDEMVLSTTHLTRFAATTLSVLADDLPTKPTHLKAKKLKTTSALLDWKAPDQSTVSSYTLQFRLTGDTKKKHWTTQADIVKTQKKVKTFTSGVKYQFRVKAYNATGYSHYTKWTGFKTK